MSPTHSAKHFQRLIAASSLPLAGAIPFQRCFIG